MPKKDCETCGGTGEGRYSSRCSECGGKGYTEDRPEPEFEPDEGDGNE